MHSPEPSLQCLQTLLSSLLLRRWHFASSFHQCLPHFQSWHLCLLLPACFSCWLQANLHWLPCLNWLSNILNTLAWPQDYVLWNFPMDSLSKVGVLSWGDPELDMCFQPKPKPQISLAILFLPILINFVFPRQILKSLPLSSKNFTLALSFLISDFVFYFLEKMEVMKVHTPIAHPTTPDTCICNNLMLFSSDFRGRKFLLFDSIPSLSSWQSFWNLIFSL